MQIEAYNLGSQPGAPRATGATGAGVGFLDRLGHADTAVDRTPASRDEKAIAAAESLVSIGFVQPLLEQARQDPFRSDLFHGGQGEDAFGAQLDAIMAERITKKMNMSLVDAVYRTIAKSQVGSAIPTGKIDARG